MSTTASDRGLIARRFQLPWPEARADAWMDYRTMETMFGIKFTDGAVFQGPDKDVVIREATAHAKVVKRLTGIFHG